MLHSHTYSETAFPSLGELRVADAMHPGLISCSFHTPLRAVARMMATYRVHAVLVTGHGQERLADGSSWGIVTDAELLRAAEQDDLEGPAFRAVASGPLLTVATTDPLAYAAYLMLEHDSSHVVAVEPRSGRPAGVLSRLDLARALAGFPEHHPADR
jgi:CBS domain-containing protein